MTILVAAMRPTIRSMQTIFAGEAKVIGATGMHDALKVLPGGVDLIIGALQFDESRMFEFLTVVKSNPRWRGIPFFCIHHLPSVLRPTAFKGLQLACRGYGAVFVDLAPLEGQYGTGEADSRFREMVLGRSSDTGTQQTLEL
jgi:hypothetical protein